MDHTAYIALGSNVGVRARNFIEAIDRLNAIVMTRVTRVATSIETAPVDCPPDAPMFLNTVVEVQTALSTTALFAGIKRIEEEMGRVRSVRNAPRVIDLDLLLFDAETVNDKSLILPHPRMHERAFVLIPLAEIAPDVVHPVLGKTIRELKDALPG